MQCVSVVNLREKETLAGVVSGGSDVNCTAVEEKKRAQQSLAKKLKSKTERNTSLNKSSKWLIINTALQNQSNE